MSFAVLPMRGFVRAQPCPCDESQRRSPEKTKTSDGAFTPTVPEDETFLHAYNCNWENFPRKNDLSHRRKQV